MILHSSSEQQFVTPYRLHLEGRRRLNTLERIRDRRKNHNPSDLSQQQQQQQQLHNKYTLKPEELQDPIIRRALERFDEKSRSLTQPRSMDYDRIQDPITRRALMRLETNLKLINPSNSTTTIASITNDSNETWYTNSYTLGSLQSNNENRLMHYPDSSLPPTPYNKTPQVSVHQRFCSASSADMSETSTSSMISSTEHEIPIMRVPAQPIYVTSNTQQQDLISLRQRSQSEDMLASKDLSIYQMENLDSNNTSQLQRNFSSNELQQPHQQVTSKNEVGSNEASFPLPTGVIKSLESNFVRTTEASVNYVTPNQAYSAYSCEYTRPHQNQVAISSKTDLSSPKNSQQPNKNETQYPVQTSSTFTSVHPSTNSCYSQQPLTGSSYTAMYTSNNLNQTPYADDPM